MRATERPCCQYVFRAGSFGGHGHGYGAQRCLAQVEDGQVYCPVHQGVTAPRPPQWRAARPHRLTWDDDDG